MIKIVDEVTGTAIKIEVIGMPYQLQVRVGKVGTWKVARGRTAGTIKTGEKWEKPMFVKDFKQAIEAAINSISENEGIPKDQIVLSQADSWNAIIESYERNNRLIEGVVNEFNKLIEEHGKDLSRLSKYLDGKMGKDTVEENDPETESSDEENSSEEKFEEDKTVDERTSFPKMEKRMKEAGVL